MVAVAAWVADVWRTWSDERRWSGYILQKCHSTARLFCFEN